MPKKVIIVGHNIESCTVARKLANEGYEVVYAQTGRLGALQDEICDWLTDEALNLIHAAGVFPDVLSIKNGRYVHVPYNKLSMTNDMNGIVPFPLTINSFGSQVEIDQMRKRISELDEFNKEMKDSPNHLAVYKRFFPKWLYDSILRRLGVNKWDIRQSKMSKDSLLEELRIEYLTQSGTGTIHYPKDGYAAMCKMLLGHPSISVSEVTLDSLKSKIPDGRGKTKMVIMDNRIDYLCDYMNGPLERMEMQGEKVNREDLKSHEEYQCIDIGVVLTPYKTYWAFSSGWGTARKTFSVKPSGPAIADTTMVVPNVGNTKLLGEYAALIKRYRERSYYRPISMTVMS